MRSFDETKQVHNGQSIDKADPIQPWGWFVEERVAAIVEECDPWVLGDGRHNKHHLEDRGHKRHHHPSAKLSSENVGIVLVRPSVDRWQSDRAGL